MSNIDYDVVIVGAGVAGCYAAYRLIESNAYHLGALGKTTLKIGLFEQSNRIGGRLFSQNHKDVVFEYGGMRFFEEITILQNLLIHLNLKDDIIDFKLREQNNIFYTRGKCFKLQEIKYAKLPYKLKPSEKGKTPDELIAELINSIMPSFSSLRSRYHKSIKKKDWRNARKKFESYTVLKNGVLAKREKLCNISWYELLQAFLSEEAINLIQDFEGYEIKESNGNASNWLDNIFLTPENVQLKKLKSGFDSITKELISLFKNKGGDISLNHKLLEINKLDNLYQLKFLKDNKITLKKCKTVILAIPKSSLKKITSPLVSVPNYNNALRSIKCIDAFKLFLVYPGAWWKMLGINEGVSTTDLPIRQVRYYSSSKDTAVIMASYCNGSDIDFWNCLKKAAIISEAHKQIVEMHGNRKIPLPVKAFYQFWEKNNGNSGWHVWKPNHDDVSNIDFSMKPSNEEDIFIIGAAWSNEPDSVQGAIRNTETVLQKYFKIPTPYWMNNEHFNT